MSEPLAIVSTVEAPTEADWFDCITQSPDEPAGHDEVGYPFSGLRENGSPEAHDG